MNTATGVATIAPVSVASARPDRRVRWKLAAITAFYFVLCVAIQWRAHAPSAAFGTYADEPAHYIGGLLVRDYVVSGLPKSPLAFSENYHDFLPYFAVGYWPPMFYCAEGLWILLFGPARGAVLLLTALIASGAAAVIMNSIRREAGWLAGICGGLVFVVLPEVQWLTCTVMVDLAVALGVLGATLLAAKYLASGSWKHSVAFAAVAAAACLTKYSAAYVCVVPLLGIVALRRWRLLRSLTFWAQPVIIGALLAPWLFFAARFATYGLPQPQHYPLIGRTLSVGKAMAFSIPWPAWLAIAAGLSLWVFRPIRWRETNVAFFVHLVAALVFLAASPVAAQLRLFTPAAGAALVVGFSSLRWVPRASWKYAAASLVVCTALSVAWAARVTPRLKVNDMAAVVEKVLAEPRWRNAPVLVTGDVEGPMIAEFAMRDPHRPGHRLIRPGKILASDDWFGDHYQSLCRTPEEAESVLDRLDIRLLILRSTADPKAPRHEGLLRQAVVGRPDFWSPAGISRSAAASHFEIFESARH